MIGTREHYILRFRRGLSVLAFACAFLAILTVKEGAVDFSNAFGTVQATAMTESTATADSAPTEPRRLKTLQVVTLADGTEWSLVSRPLDGPEAAEKLVGGGGWVGVELRDVAENSAALITAPAGPWPAQVRVGQVWPGTPAAQAGFQVGDVVLTLDGRAVSRASEVERALLLRPGEALMLRVRRGNLHAQRAQPIPHQRTSCGFQLL